MIDFHADTMYRLWHEATDQNLQENSLSVSVNGLEKIGAMAQCLAIYTPPAALEALSDGLAAGDPSACFGIEDEAAHEVFDTVFVPDGAAMWSLAYEAWPDAVVIYDESSGWEVALAGSSPVRTLS